MSHNSLISLSSLNPPHQAMLAKIVYLWEQIFKSVTFKVKHTVD